MKFDLNLWLLRVKIELFPSQQDKTEEEAKEQGHAQEQSGAQQSETHGQNDLSMQSGEFRLSAPSRTGKVQNGFADNAPPVSFCVILQAGRNKQMCWPMRRVTV